MLLCKLEPFVLYEKKKSLNFVNGSADKKFNVKKSLKQEVTIIGKGLKELMTKVTKKHVFKVQIGKIRM